MDDGKRSLSTQGRGAWGLCLDPETLTMLDGAQLAAVLDEQKVIVAPGAHLDREGHLDLARKFGPLMVHPYLANHRSPDPQVLVMEGARALADTFHADETFLDVPPETCVLRLHTLPDLGGNTTWRNLEAAYAALPTEVRTRLSCAVAVHRTPDGDCEAVHPVVRAHPRTGRPGLFINRLYTVAIEAVGDTTGSFLAELLDHSEDPAFAFEHEWGSGDIAIWDNCSTLHKVANDFDTYRRVERLAILGKSPTRFES